MSRFNPDACLHCGQLFAGKYDTSQQPLSKYTDRIITDVPKVHNFCWMAISPERKEELIGRGQEMELEVAQEAAEAAFKTEQGPVLIAPTPMMLNGRKYPRPQAQPQSRIERYLGLPRTVAERRSTRQGFTADRK